MYIGFGLIRKYSTNELGKMGFFVKGIMKESGFSGSAMDEGYECELRTLMGLGRDFDYHNGFYALISYIMSEKAKGAAQSLPQQPPQPAIPASKMEKRYQQMRQGTVKPRFRSDVPTELLRKMRERGYSYERISRETGLSKSAVIYRLK